MKKKKKAFSILYCGLVFGEKTRNTEIVSLSWIYLCACIFCQVESLFESGRSWNNNDSLFLLPESDRTAFQIWTICRTLCLLMFTDREAHVSISSSSFFYWSILSCRFAQNYLSIFLSILSPRVKLPLHSIDVDLGDRITHRFYFLWDGVFIIYWRPSALIL